MSAGQCITIGLSLLLVAAAPAAQPSTRPGVTVGNDTTRITRPLRADGTVDYVAALNAHISKGVTPENNAAIPLLRALGPKPYAFDPGKAALVWPALGMAPLPAEGEYFVSLDEFLARHAKPGDDVDELRRSLRKFEPWTAVDAPLPSQWLASQDAALDRIAAASRLPHLYTPFLPTKSGTVISLVSNGLNAYRPVTEALACRATFRLGAGDFEGFRSDVEACERLARLIRHRPFLVDHLVAMGCDAMAIDVVTGVATSERISAATAKQFLHDLDRPGPIPPPAEAVDLGERFAMLDFTTIASRVGWANAAKIVGGGGAGGLPVTGLPTKDWNAALRKTNGRYDRIVEAMRRDTFAERRSAMRAFDDELQRDRVKAHGVLGVTLPVEDRVASIMTPALSRSVEFAQRLVTARDLARVALVLAAHRADHGSYPKSLDELVPAYLPKLPHDAFAPSESTFRYELNALGGYRLFSVGFNGTDERPRHEHFTVDDIIVLGGKQPPPGPPPTEVEIEVPDAK